jgi:hypothetical protein
MHLWVFLLHQVIYVLKNSNNKFVYFLGFLGHAMDASIFSEGMIFLLENNLESQGTLIID